MTETKEKKKEKKIVEKNNNNIGFSILCAIPIPHKSSSSSGNAAF
jgi:hypothetical protein